MSRLQLALDVDDLESSIAFYSGLFGTEPAKVKPGYANFAIADPPLKLVLVDVDTVDRELSRLSAAGFASAEERDTTCCYAKQDKFWVENTPNGERWEVYTVLEDAETFSGEAQESTCCGGTC